MPPSEDKQHSTDPYASLRHSFVRQRVCGLKSPRREMKSIVVLGECWADGSGSEASDYRVLAGLLNQADAWDDFFGEWEEELAKPPSLPFWHQAEARSRRNPPYRGCDGGDLWRKELALAEIVRRYAMCGLGVSMSNADWLKYGHGRVDPSLIPGMPKRLWAKWIEEFDSPYQVLFPMMYALVNNSVRDNRFVDRADITFEQDNSKEEQSVKRFATTAQLLFEDFNLSLGTRSEVRALGQISFAPGKQPDTRPLEAADMYVWCIRRYAVELKKREPIWDILDHVPRRILPAGQKEIEVHTKWLARGGAEEGG